MNLKIDSVRFAYRSVEVLKGLSFEAPPGCITAILGKNGSGKTTLLKTINRLLKPEGGSAWIDGMSVLEMSRQEIARRFAYMPQQQEPTAFPVFETVLLGKKAVAGGHITEDDVHKISAILDLVGLGNSAMRRASELSGGELQKVALARALAQAPRVLLLDEPINHLDPANQMEMMSLLRAVTKKLGIISLIVTHNLNNALQFADRFVFLKSGVVQAAGGVETITQDTIYKVFGIYAAIEKTGDTCLVVPTMRGLKSAKDYESSDFFSRTPD